MKSVLMCGLILILTFAFSCTRQMKHYGEGIIKSNVIYKDLSYQIDYALQTTSKDSKRAQRLKLIDEKLKEYKAYYDSFLTVLNNWEKTGKEPENRMELYEAMWRSILDAQNLAANSYIYASECSTRTAIKGKAGNNCP
ncbi:hypothetical protein MYX76_11940 [Desulfobacterota bacterium AH_259_B03_O07]|nr:hypothetical protein [Desulfobacterota bacterium AH_259_B03_O07]